MRMKYKNPPISELVIGVYFSDPILEMRAEHIGLFWAKVSDNFPRSSQNMPIGNIDITTPGEVFPLPRFWFISDDDAYLIQIQRNAFLLNWRKRDEDYPHYNPMKSKFDQYYSIFADFCASQLGTVNLKIQRCELSYINLIEDESYFRSFADVRNVIPSYQPLSIGDDGREPTNPNLRYIYPFSDDLGLSVAVQHRKNLSTENEVLYLELKATGELKEKTKSSADLWFERAHNVIGDAFNNLTSADLQRDHWLPMET